MRMSKLFGARFKEKPADASIASHIFMLRGGYMRSVGTGIFSLLPPARRIQSKIEAILREEMDAVGGQEVLLPVAMPADLWEESGRFTSVGPELLRFKDRLGHDMVLGMTHEEAAVHLARTEAQTYADYPFMFYQIQTKFRDEPRSRAGLIRVREFTMKDGYSFHTSQEDLEKYYDEVYHAYERIFHRVGLDVVVVGSDSGMMGGSLAHEFMVLADCGEDSLVICAQCGYNANMEVAQSVILKESHAPAALQETATPDVTEIEALTVLLGLPAQRMCKAVVFTQENTEEVLLAFLRADRQVNETKLRTAVGRNVFPLTTQEGIDLCFGFIGPVGLKDDKRIKVLFDSSLEGEENLVCGANKKDAHLLNMSIPRDVKPSSFVDMSKVNEGDACTHCGAPLPIHRGIEAGNIFQLGDKYTKAMGMTYIDADAAQKTPIMGCYGIGVGRMIPCILQTHHDEYGPIWPYAVAPWQVHICMMNASIDEVKATGEMLYDTLGKDYEVMLDDRATSAGAMFADADLLGVPIRLIVSKRNLAQGKIELVTRDKTIKELVDVADIAGAVAKVAKELMARCTPS